MAPPRTIQPDVSKEFQVTVNRSPSFRPIAAKCGSLANSEKTDENVWVFEELKVKIRCETRIVRRTGTSPASSARTPILADSSPEPT